MAITIQLSKTQKITGSVAGIIVSLGVILTFFAPMIPFAYAEELESLDERVVALEQMPQKIDAIQDHLEQMAVDKEEEDKQSKKQKLVDRIKEIEGFIVEIDLDLQFAETEKQKAKLIQKKIYWTGERRKVQTDLNALNTD